MQGPPTSKLIKDGVEADASSIGTLARSANRLPPRSRESIRFVLRPRGSSHPPRPGDGTGGTRHDQRVKRYPPRVSRQHVPEHAGAPWLLPFVVVVEVHADHVQIPGRAPSDGSLWPISMSHASNLCFPCTRYNVQSSAPGRDGMNHTLHRDEPCVRTDLAYGVDRQQSTRAPTGASCRNHDQ